LTDPLGELLVERSHITPDQLKEALEEQKSKGGALESNLIRQGLLESSFHGGSSSLSRTNSVKKLAKY